MQDALAAKNISLIKETPLPLHANSIPYYEGCLLKLAAFRLHVYDSSIQRLLVLDADQLILRNLDMIFDTQMTDFMAPTAYWISNDTITSTCMLIQPGKPMWDRVKAAAKSIKSDKYDMDLINDLFAERGDRLSERYVTLNSHWEDWNIPLWMGSRSSNGTATDQQLRALYDQAAIIHFTAAGKPWMHDTQALREHWHTWAKLRMHTSRTPRVAIYTSVPSHQNTMYIPEIKSPKPYTIHGFGMVRQRVITSREAKAYDGSDNEKRKDNVVLDGNIGVLCVKVSQDNALANYEG
ncbi:hypothetical protein MAA_10052 [Metarhizium robertsii ARSEF 23]|uniref:Glycosyl transferase family 8 protein n=1 Tax=Metarhizium robertsii (strain ARSEF 23 / ATCC MYA-3075) TaxID=655844 RepID=E9FCQ3_METRA|nr:uncharacterized protein MAA_10052 [Metarhizium robertsii ARSEF 23]EFY94473.1 hypothetical protein MAA_10052 [Metarhizium robertsii ARSEF 23]